MRAQTIQDLFPVGDREYVCVCVCMYAMGEGGCAEHFFAVEIDDGVHFRVGDGSFFTAPVTRRCKFRAH